MIGLWQRVGVACQPRANAYKYVRSASAWHLTLVCAPRKELFSSIPNRRQLGPLKDYIISDINYCLEYTCNEKPRRDWDHGQKGKYIYFFLCILTNRGQTEQHVYFNITWPVHWHWSVMFPAAVKTSGRKTKKRKDESESGEPENAASARPWAQCKNTILFIFSA